MQGAIVSGFLLPLALAVVMFGLGLSLTLADFARVARMPHAVLVGLTLQTLVLPPVAFALAIVFHLPSELAVGLMILAASPGGATANIYSHLARGDVALNITLTATNSVLCLLTLPLIVGLSLDYFMAAERAVPPPFGKILEVGLLILVPVAGGMWLRAGRPRFAERMERPVKLLSVLVLVALIAAAAWEERAALARHFAVVGLACLSFNLISLATGYLGPLALRLPPRQAIAIAMEIGIHNGTLAIFIALHVLGNATMAIPAAVYSLVMFVTAAVFAVWFHRHRAT